MLNKIVYKELVAEIRNLCSNIERDYLICTLFIDKESRGYNLKSITNSIEHKINIKIPTFPQLSREIFEPYVNEEFNEVVLNIIENDFTVSYQLNKLKINESLQESALLFPNYIYENIRSQIYQYEQTNKILNPIYDDDGDVMGYEKSWDKGLFTFIVDFNSKIINHKIELYKGDKHRILPLELSEAFTKAVFKHYEITHNDLIKYWKPWNKITLTAPKDFIPLGKEQKYIDYSLIEINNQ